ncbi:MAG: type II toxin-antitoxin system RelE/ParE family toxin [Lacipirellulaceae bacterium]
MSEATWTDRAEFELEQILRYITVHAHRPLTAERLARSVKAQADLRATQPRSGEARPDLGEGLHMFLHQRVSCSIGPMSVASRSSGLSMARETMETFSAPLRPLTTSARTSRRRWGRRSPP